MRLQVLRSLTSFSLFLCAKGFATMSFSISGGQLPLTVYFGSRSAQKRKSTEPRVAATHKDPSESRREAGPSTKRKRQKENHTPRASSSRKAGQSQSTSSRVQGETAAIDLTRDSEEQDSGFDDVHLHKDDSSHHFSTPTSLELPPATPVAHVRSRATLAAASLPSPPPTAPSAKRVRRVRDDTKETNDPNLVGTLVGQSDRGSSLHADGSYTLYYSSVQLSNISPLILSHAGEHNCAGRRKQRCHCTSVSSKRTRSHHVASTLAAQSVLVDHAYTPITSTSPLIFIR